MKTITALKVQVRDKNKVNLSLDGDYFCALSLEIVVKHNLKVGMIVDEKILEDIQLESEKKLAFELALKLVSARYKTKKEVEQYLQTKEYAPQTIWYVVKKLSEYNYIDDERYAESFVSHHIQKDGVLKIKHQLLSKGIKEDIINKALNGIDNQLNQIQLLAQKYMKNKEETKENYAKMYRYLIGKGFKSEEIMKVMKGDYL